MSDDIPIQNLSNGGVQIVCMHCGGKVRASLVDPTFAHSKPPCEAFLDCKGIDEATEFLKAHRRFYSSVN